ncbi:DUF4231 domain-containing protein [Agrobacterium deltaense]|uniref:DUF4231 domain-containing protein n=1 Tax=Agrobacterium deltaense TaxID=1183412 RepID=UPI0009B9BFAB|nr:DUF4231 domain-containing protein [Agrobacterium deltaense]CUX19452.1 hypothetical protein AGR7B_Cc200013 [Agrobacterium deltaense RV3]
MNSISDNTDDDNFEITDKYRFREKKLLDEIQRSVEYYVRYGQIAQKWQRITAMLVMVLSTFAPLLVVGSTTSLPVLSEEVVSFAAFLVTLLLALLEGTRRIFRFEQRWMACYMAKQTLKREREKYRFARIGLVVGSDVWKANLADLRRVYDEVTGSETKEFFAALQSPMPDLKRP